MSHLRLLSAVVLLALGLAGGPPAAADWIVTTDGERIETRGPWEVKGRLVVLTLANGELASMRLSNVDLEASRRATQEAARAMQAAPAEAEDAKSAGADAPRPSKIVLTDDDFTTVRRPVVDAEEEDAEGDETQSVAPLVVIASEDAQDPETGGMVVSGILANRSNDALANVALTVRLLDVEGEMLEEMDAELSSPSLSPGARASFRARFPDVLAFAEVEFEPRSVALLTASEPSQEEPQGR